MTAPARPWSGWRSWFDKAEVGSKYTDENGTFIIPFLIFVLALFFMGKERHRMKVILSRKGFDSANGKISSPIFEDGTMISFPIPSNDTDTYDSLEYCGMTYSKILSDLRYKGGARCHIDPDLDDTRRIRKFPEWIPAFGQISSSASYLKNIGIKEGDLFLFFGNFHKVKLVSGSYTYCRRTGDSIVIRICR